MKSTDAFEFGSLWDQCAELYGKKVSPEAKELAFKLLVKYDIGVIKQAFKAHMLDADAGRYMPKPADLVAKIQAVTPNGFPGAQQAWASFPRDETQTACICDEMAVAWGVAFGLDEIPGRMAFIEAYNQQVARAKAEGRAPRWYITQGSDKEQVSSVALKAVTERKLTPMQATSYIDIDVQELEALADGRITANRLLDQHAQHVNGVEQLLLTNDGKHADNSVVKNHIAKIRKILSMG